MKTPITITALTCTLALWAGAADPVVAPAFTPLPLGQIEPSGWLRDWAVAARDGITGHLDERNPVFRDGWKGTPIRWTNASPDGTGWPLEQSAYWLDGAIQLGYILHDEPLITKIRARLDSVVDGVNKAPDGTSLIYWKPGYKPEGFNGWAHSHMARALVSLYNGSGDKRVLNALVKVFASYPEDMGPLNFGPIGGKVTGLCNLDPLLETYRYSGDRHLLDRAIATFNRAEAQATTAQWADGEIGHNHLVIMLENIRLPAVMYPWTGNPAHLKAASKALDWLERNCGLPYSLPSGEEVASNIGAERKTEICNVPAMLLAESWMYRIQADGTWGDRMEKVFFNAGAAPIARDFKTAAYYQAPNRIRLGVLPVESPAPGKGGISYGPLACDHVLCCIGACNRILPGYIANMWMCTSDNGLAATLYGPCTVNTKTGSGVSVRITSVTDYPFNESIRMTLDPERSAVFPLYLRIPSWCSSPEIRINGETITAEPAPGKNGFVRISREWGRGDTVEIRTPMTVSVVRAYDSGYPVSQRGYFRNIPAPLFHNRSQPFASVHYGPLLFALPIPEIDDNTPADDAKWQYALDLNPADSAKITAEHKPMPARWDWPYDAPLTLRVPARAIDWKPDMKQALPPSPVTGGDKETVRLVPYGCTKFHISMFPVTPRAWEGMPPAPRDPVSLLGEAGIYQDPSARGGNAVGYLNKPGCGVEYRGLPAGDLLKIRYAALKDAQLTLRVNGGAPQKVTFPATGKWQGNGAYAETKVSTAIPADATISLSFEPGDTPANIDSMEVTK